MTQPARPPRLGPLAKLAIVAAGYVAAFAVASAAVALRVAVTNGPDAQGSGGMHAFGDVLLFLAAFGAMSVAPTVLGLWWLRAWPPFWTILAVLALGVGLTAPLSIAGFWAGSAVPPAMQAVRVAGALAVFRLLVSPLFAVAFALGALLSPLRNARLMLVAATGFEATAALAAVVTFFLRPLVSNLLS